MTSGQLIIADALAITGPGADKLAVSGNLASRVFEIGAGVDVSLSGMTIRDGVDSGYDGGGGIYNAGTLIFSDSTITNNTAETGGAIVNYGSLVVTGTTFYNNSSVGGGGIATAGNLKVSSSTFDANSATIGGGISIYGITSQAVTISESTFSNNTSIGNGAGIWFYGDDESVNVVNSTFSGNSSGSSGGGIYFEYGTVHLNNVTISNNSANEGGGIYNVGYGLVWSRNSIVARNDAPSEPDIYGRIVSEGHNLVGFVSTVFGQILIQPGVLGDIWSEDPLNPIDPLLGPLGDFGGPTQTMPLVPGSPALNAGGNILAVDVLGAPLTTDQRGIGFDRIVNGTVDIGAFESHVVLFPPVIGAFDAAVAYTENGAAVVLDANATLTDADSLDFIGGVMTVSLIANSESSDRLSIRNVGTGAGQIGVVGNQVTYAGNVIGTFTGGTSGDAPLVITLGAGGSKVAAQALLRKLTFSSLSESPSTFPRTVQVVMTDGDGSVSLPATKSINVNAVNDAPVIANFAGVASYTEGDVPILVGSGATISDVDSADFDLGRLTVRVSVNSQSSDRLSIRHEGLATGQIGVNGTDVLYGNVIIGSFTGTTTLIVTLNGNANAAALQSLLRNVTFHSISMSPSTLTRTISATLNDGDGGTSVAVTTFVNLIAVNNAPTIGAFDATVSYVENATPLLLDANATVIDGDLVDFADGVLTARLVANSHADDRLGIRNQGVGANQIGINLVDVTYGGVVIGTFSGGTSGSDPLTILLNANANQAAVQALVRNLTFRNVSDAPSTSARTVELQLTDGDGGSSVPVSKSINVTAVNDAPVISNFSGISIYTEDEAAVDLAINAIVEDLDSADFDLGRLIARISANAQATDRITIRNDGTSAGQIGVSGTNVTYSGDVIGTFSGTIALTISLNSAATPTAVQALLRNLSFSSLSGAPSTLQRTITATLSDGDGGTSLAVTTSVEVIAVNDAPVIGVFTPDITYVENAVPLLLDSNTTVSDVDSLDFENGVLTVNLTVNGHADDRLSIRNQGTAANQIGVVGNQVTFGGVAIGTFLGGASGLTSLQITFTLSASKAAVQALVRNLTFSNVSENPSTLPRTVSLTLNDGDGGTSIPVTKTINVSAVNDAPTIGGFGGNVGYAIGGPAVVLDSDATVDDPDTENFNFGVLTVSLTTNRQATDRVEILSVGTGVGQISVLNNQVFYEGVLIGAFGGTTTLTVTLNASASKAAVQSLLRSITFRNLSATPSTLSRTVSVRLSDGVGGTSVAQTKVIDML